jgi:ParB family chromosome partitioning protein
MATIERVKLKDLIESPYQGRLIKLPSEKDTSAQAELVQLAESIENNGLLQPIVLRKTTVGYEIIDGHRRVEAFRMLGRGDIQAIVREMDDREAQIMSVVANIQRENLSNIERAIAFKKILNEGIFKDKRELSKAIGKDETYVGDLMNILNMDQRIIDDVVMNKTTNDVRLLRAIRKVEPVNRDGVSEKQFKVYNQFKAEKLTRREVLDLVKEQKDKKESPVSISGHLKKYEIKVHSKLNKEQRAKFAQLLELKVIEILKEL